MFVNVFAKKFPSYLSVTPFFLAPLAATNSSRIILSSTQGSSLVQGEMASRSRRP